MEEKYNLWHTIHLIVTQSARFGCFAFLCGFVYVCIFICVLLAFDPQRIEFPRTRTRISPPTKQ